MPREWMLTTPCSCIRGDVVLVAFPNSDLITFKQRPALVVQDTSVPTGLAQLVVACITSNLARSGPTRVFVAQRSSEGTAMGLRTDSAVVLDNLATVPQRALIKKIGKCNPMAEVDLALRKVLGL